MSEVVADNLYTTAINALTYGMSCLVYDKYNDLLLECTLSIHESYLNILHLLISRSFSYLLRLQEIYSIADHQFSVDARMRKDKIQHYLVLYTQSLESVVFAVKTESEKGILRVGLTYFVREAKLFYQRLEEYDPFKAESMMTFLDADKDGGSLLDIKEIENILAQMKIKKETIREDIFDINKYLYDREKMKRPNGMGDSELTEFGFQMLLRFYSIKEDLAKYFTLYCPMFKLKTRSSKNSIIDIVRANEKPLMSANQLKDFYESILYEKIEEWECLELIRSYPVYDGEGKESLSKHDMIGFNNFCSLLSSRRNNAIPEHLKKINHQMDHPLADYYIYTDSTQLSSEGKINPFELSLKRGCRCIRIKMENGKSGSPVVMIDAHTPIGLEEVLKIFNQKAFQFNPFPLLLNIENDCSKDQSDCAAKIIADTLSNCLYTLPPNFTQYNHLPSPNELKEKIMLMSNGNFKLLKSKEKDFPSESVSFNRLISLVQVKLDFERKGQICWNYCRLDGAQVASCEEIQDQNICNYAKKVLLYIGADSKSKCGPSLAMRMGVHMVGLDFAEIDGDNYYMQSLFFENGGSHCGYLLKPPWMHVQDTKALYPKNFNVPLHMMRLTVVSGQNCLINCKVDCAYTLSVSLRGNKEEQSTNKTYTSEVKTGGYYTSFCLECQFTIYCPSLAVIVMEIKDRNGKVLTGRSVNLRNLREGLRAVFLIGENLKEINNSYLIIESKREEMPKRGNYFTQFK